MNGNTLSNPQNRERMLQRINRSFVRVNGCVLKVLCTGWTYIYVFQTYACADFNLNLWIPGRLLSFINCCHCCYTLLRRGSIRFWTELQIVLPAAHTHKTCDDTTKILYSTWIWIVSSNWLSAISQYHPIHAGDRHQSESVFSIIHKNNSSPTDIHPEATAAHSNQTRSLVGFWAYTHSFDVIHTLCSCTASVCVCAAHILHSIIIQYIDSPWTCFRTTFSRRKLNFCIVQNIECV